MDVIYACFRDEEEDKVEDECDQSNECSEARNARTETGHGHFSDVRQQSKDGCNCGQDKSYDVKNKSPGNPFRDDDWDLEQFAVIAQQGIGI